jgi:hypothetical protein
MPFFTPSKDTKTYIDFDRYQPVSVICCTLADGSMTPMRFKIALPDKSEETYNITGITQTKEYRDRIAFRCLFTSGKRQQAIMLEFYIEDHVWVTLRL